MLRASGRGIAALVRASSNAARASVATPTSYHDNSTIPAASRATSLRVEMSSKRLQIPSLVGPQLRFCSSTTATTVKPDEVLTDDAPAAAEKDAAPPKPPPMRNDEKATGTATTHEFQAETRQLLDIVARSLYSEKEVFIRELVSNASDAVEKMRYLTLTGGQSGSDIIGGSVNLSNASRELKIEIATDKVGRTLTIADSGIGMTKDEMVSNLGTIARSGSKAFIKEFMEKGDKPSADPKDIIGQFGVGFYSAFMVADKIEVFSKSSKDSNVGHR